VFEDAWAEHAGRLRADGIFDPHYYASYNERRISEASAVVDINAVFVHPHGEPNAMPSAGTSSCSVRSVPTSMTVEGAGAQKLFFTRFCATEFVLPTPSNPQRSSMDGWCSARPSNGSHWSVNVPKTGGGRRRTAQAATAKATAATRTMRQGLTHRVYATRLSAPRAETCQSRAALRSDDGRRRLVQAAPDARSGRLANAGIARSADRIENSNA